MTDNFNNTEKQAVSENASAGSAEQSRESFSNEAIAESMKNAQKGSSSSRDSQGGGGSSSSRDSQGGGGSSSDHLPNVIMDGIEQGGKASRDAKQIGGKAIGEGGGKAAENAAHSAGKAIGESAIKAAENAAHSAGKAIGESAGKAAENAANSAGKAIGEGAGKAAENAARSAGKAYGESIGKSGADSINQSGKSAENKMNLKDMENSTQNSTMQKSDKLGDLLKDGKISHEDFKNGLKDLFKPKDGVESLPTGDHIVREDGKQSLFTPNGDRITINPDGTHTIKGDVSKVSTGKDGVTSVEFGDGSRVEFDREGFLSVQRGDQGVAFGRPAHIDFGKPWNQKPWHEPYNHPIEAKPWHGPKDPPINGSAKPHYDVDPRFLMDKSKNK